MRAESGAYGELEPSSSTVGPSREPRIAPPAKPASESAPTIRPWAYPRRHQDRAGDDDPVERVTADAG